VIFEVIFNYFKRLIGIGPEWHWLIFLIAALLSIIGVIWSIFRLSRKDKYEESVGLITPNRYEKAEPSLIQRVIEWLNEH
jgi:hypothetical protein